MSAARKADQPRSTDAERLEAVCAVLSARITELEVSNAELRAKLNLDPPPPALGSDWMTIKQAAFVTGLTVSGVRRRIERGQIATTKSGGRVLVSTASLRAGRKNVSLALPRNA